MNQLVGRIESLSVKPGLRIGLEIQISISNPNESGIDITWLSARAAIAFLDMSSQALPAEQPRNLGHAFPEYGLLSIAPSGRSTLTVSLPIDPKLIAEIEDERREKDVVFYLYANYTGVPRTRDGSLGSPFNGAMGDEKYSGQVIIFLIPRSLWQQTLQRSPIQSIDALKDLSRIISETLVAKSAAEQAAKAAEEAAKAAKGAATLTAVTNLAQAYQEEAQTLKRRSYIWATFCILIAFGIAGGVFAFIKESLALGANFSVSIAILRAAVLAISFGIFSLCLRVYESYRHLEVVNRHRVNIGRTFEAFKAAQPTERAQEIMSAITAENLLTFGKSGFAPKDSPNQGAGTDFPELIKSILDKK